LFIKNFHSFFKRKYTHKFNINSSLHKRSARQDHVRPLLPNRNGTANNEVGDGDGVVNDEIGSPIIQVTYTKPNTLTAPFNPEVVLRPINREQNYIKFPIMEPRLNNFNRLPADEAIKLGSGQRTANYFPASSFDEAIKLGSDQRTAKYFSASSFDEAIKLGPDQRTANYFPVSSFDEAIKSGSDQRTANHFPASSFEEATKLGLSQGAGADSNMLANIS
jgi:hypothetical protein